MMPIYALAGFLGQRSDWEQFKELGLCSIDPFQSCFAYPSKGLPAWAESFNHFAAKESKSKILLGYSLGGRLALHALCSAPHFWQAAIIISAHPGLKLEARSARIKEDELWAKRFESEPWQSLMLSWNQRGALASSKPLLRSERKYERASLAAALRGWSLGRQEDLSPLISQLPMPLLWMVGEQDNYFCQISRQIRLVNPSSQNCIIPKAGHRLPWDNPKIFTYTIRDFLGGLIF